jgi:phosphotransferase system  glucose/maltose/N-acetylglucosamine-specific IIC component
LESSFGVLDAFAFVVMAVLICAGIVIVVNVGKLPGQLAHKWGHPQAAAINAMGWVGIATGGLLWPIALIWAFSKPFGIRRSVESEAATITPLRKPAVDKETPQ